MDKITFQETAEASIREGKAALLSLSRSEANNFVNGSAQFNPEALVRLGISGMTAFLQTVRAHGIAVDQPLADACQAPPTTPPTSATLTPGWANKHCAEPNWILITIAHGTLTGLGLIALGATCLAFLNW